MATTFNLRIDPDWLNQFQDAQAAWDSPLGRGLTVTFYDLEDGLEESAEVNYADSEVIGRAESFKSYVGNGNRELPFTFRFYAQGISRENLQGTLQREVVDPAKWLEALKFPYIAPNGIAYPPPRVIVRLGQLLQARCIATDVSIKWEAPFDPDSMLPYGAEVSCTLTVVHERATNYPFRRSER